MAHISFDAVAQALAFNEEYEQAREHDHQREHLQALLASAEHGQSKSAIALLDAEMVLMEDAWAKLIRSTSEIDRGLLGGDQYDFESVRNAIEVWGQRYEKKQDEEYNKAKANFNRFCATMDSYSGLLNFIPHDDKYVKPFCGVLTTIVKASVNRGKIANGFASALADIGFEMTFWKDQLAAFHDRTSVTSSERLVRIVVQLYTKVFHFLVPYLKWGQSGWERFKGSLNKNYYESNIQGPLEDVKKFSNYLKREADVESSEILVRVEQLAEKSAERLKSVENLVLEIIREKRESRLMVANFSADDIMSCGKRLAGMMYIGDCGQVMLMANSEEATYHQRMGAVPSFPERLFDTSTSENVEQTYQQTMATNELTYAELAMRSQALGFVTTGFTGDIVEIAQKTSGKVYLTLKEWLSASESRILWIYGPSHTDKPSNISAASAFVISMITHAKAPLIAHRCGNSGSAIEALISMVYSVIVQLVWLLPDKFSTDKDLSPNRFNILDRSRETLPHALILMDDLLSLSPKLLVVVLDGVQQCEDGREGDKGTGDFLNVFLEILKEGKKDRVLKVLFTTDGVCDILWCELEPRERVNVMLEGGAAGRRKKGRVAMAGLGMGED